MKLFYSPIFLAILGACSVNAWASTSVVTTEGSDGTSDREVIDASGSDYAVSSLEGFTLNMMGSDVNITSGSKGGVISQTSNSTTTNSVINFGTKDSLVNKVSITGSSVAVLAGQEQNNQSEVPGEINIYAKEISLSSTGSSGVRSGAGSLVNIGTEGTEKIEISSSRNYAVSANSGKVNLTAKEITINSGFFGIHAGNNTESETLPENGAAVIINASQTNITASAVGIANYSNGYVEVNGNLKIVAPYAIDVRGNSLTEINKNGNGAVQIDGIIQFETPGSEGNSGYSVDATVNLNLTGKDSYWTGHMQSDYPDSVQEGNEGPKHLNLSLSDGAQWNPTYYDQVEQGPSANFEAVHEVTLNDGVINITDNRIVADVKNLKGTGGTINLVSNVGSDGIETGKVNFTGDVDANTLVSVNAVGITSDDVENIQEALNSINGAVTGSNLTKQNIISEGDIRGAGIQYVSSDGTTRTEINENTKLASFRGLNATALVAWRDEVAYTNQRMEFLRDNTHAYGAWAQVYGGESKYEDKAELTTTTVQVGADITIGDWVAGAAFSYMTGEADLLRGDADTDAYTLSLYAERNFDSGLFVNGLARYGRLSTDATAGNMDASYDNNAFSLGGNVGYRFTFAEQAFVEPNFGLQYAYVMGDDYKASNGVKVKQDDFDALIASLGARIGFNFPNNAGKLFARASVNHDFLGEIDGTASKADLAESMYVDLGGTWVTYGVGTQFNITDNLSVWGNVDRTTGGEVSTNYMMNAGLRYVF